MHISKIKSGPKKYSLAHDVPWENPQVSTSCSHGIIQFFSPLASFLLEALYAFIKDPKALYLYYHHAQKPLSVICIHPLALHCLQAYGWGRNRKYGCLLQDSCFAPETRKTQFKKKKSFQ